MTTISTETATTEKKPRDPIAQGKHILKSYLKAVNIGFHDSGKKGKLFVEKKGDAKQMLVVQFDDKNNPTDLYVDPEEITSYDFDKAVLAFWSVTDAAGYGTPLPIDRGQKRGRVNYLEDDGFELVYMRHTTFRRSPNKTEAEMEPYMPTVKSSARRAFYRWGSVFTAMGFDVDDLVNVGRIYTTSFLHNYAVSEELIEQLKLLSAYLKQRYGEFAKICYKKALNATCLPAQVKSGPVATSSEGEEIDYIETYAEAEGPAADEEYEAGEYTATIETVKGPIEAKLVVRPARMLGVDLYLNGSMLPKSQAEAFRDAINAGRVKLTPIHTPDEEQQQESDLERRLRIREELNAKLSAMTPEQREHALGYAAFSRDYDPDARREARRLSEELACPKCLKKVPSGAVCLTCGVEARPRYGVDYAAYRERLKAERHSLAEAMTAPIPESEVRQKRAQVSNNVPLVAVKSDEKTPETPSVVMTKEQIRDVKTRSKELADKLMASLPDILVCPKCRAEKSKHEFGIRVPRDKETGIPQRAVRQSYCKPCRRTQ